jgi:hypothetical protein
MDAYIKSTERSQINELMLNLKLLEKEEQAKPKTIRRTDYKNMGPNQLNRDQKTIQRTNKIKNCFFEKINKNDTPLANLTKRRREKTQDNKIRTGKGNPENHQGQL